MKGLWATGRCYADALGSILGIESRAWRRLDVALLAEAELRNAVTQLVLEEAA